MAQTTYAQDLGSIERFLADSVPFGDCDYIHQSTWQLYERRLEMLSEHIPSSESLLAAIRNASPERRYRVVGDPVLRAVINDALGHYKLQVLHPEPEDFDAVMREAVTFCAEGRSDTPVTGSFRTNMRLGDAPYHGWLYSKDGVESVFSRGFTSLWDRVTSLRVKEPTDQEYRSLTSAARLLDELFPRLSRSALAHTHLVVMVEPPSEGFTSVTFPDIRGTLVLAPPALKTPWAAAEWLLHEAMHVKFIDLEHTHSLVRAGYRNFTSPIIHPLWHRPDPDGSRNWPVKRCLTVMHVYTTLALYFRTVEQRAADLEDVYGPLGDLDPALEARHAFDRAYFLGHELQRHEAELGPAGMHFVKWLIGIMDKFDPSPPPADAKVHLLLDLYEREANDLQVKLAAKASEPSVIRLVEKIRARELTKAREVLSMLGEASATQPPSWDETMSADAQLWEARMWVKRSLGDVPIEAYSLSREGQRMPAELVQEMIDESGDDVRTLYRKLALA